ncbi:hypothetical protein M413DRAFT_441989 [Hebeloma cylindrosporum]|uniref:Uncharacterized protein n=1 Tax=Hebeloma cylindrosporum TaxID=76867 RepID=A0A0C2YWD3_HEBCY|nr:hypothetical protein M413DRAFT_441989 [Hebeloma cylindrosporum h7]
MPPKAKPASSSKDLVPVGPRDVSSKTHSKPKRDEKGQKPTTSRALVLRNGKYGSQGTGEVILMGRMSGREKMDLLAEDLVKESKKAILSPFRLEKCLKIAEAQSELYVDDIANLRDPEFFRHLIEAELLARAQPGKDAPRRPSHVAKVVATRIHNSYMLASAWKIVSDSLNALAVDGVSDRNIKMKLKSNPDIRERYLVLYDTVNVLVKMSQDRVSVLATTTPHFARYFKISEFSDPGKSEYVFDWKDTNLRGAADSFLDSIIIELCFPQGTYPKAILFRILHDAIEETPREEKYFPQVLWDAVGDLSVSLELQELLEAPLFGAEGEAWKQQPRQMPEEYESWVDAQIYSERASNMIANFKDVFISLDKTRNKTVLDNIWNQMNSNYISVCGEDMDSLWKLHEAFHYAPQWSSYAMPDISEESDSDTAWKKTALVKKSHKKSRLAITNGDDSDSSMPGLQSVSNTSDDDDDDDDDEDSEYESDEESDDDQAGYNTEEEDENRDMLREAMDMAHEADWLSGTDLPPEIDPFLQEDRKGNPFLKLLGSLRGRVFSSDAKLKTTTRTEPRTTAARGAFRATPGGAPKQVPTTLPPKPEPAPIPKTPSAPTTGTVPRPPASQKATVEDVEDEDDVQASPRKKKKKKPKKKKKTTSLDSPPASPSPSAPSIESVASAAAKMNLSEQPSPKKSASISSVNSSLKPSLPKSAPSPFYSSTTSLGIGETTTAQSAHSYLQTINAKTEKKIKTRPDHASLFSNDDDEKRGLFSKISSKVTGKDREKEMKEAKQSWFSKLSKKTTGYMHQLLKTGEDSGAVGKGSMKWEQFLKIMREMGFSYDPSTAGSSVRFDPPNPNDRPITFHKPHPDPTLTPVLRDKYAKRLKRVYGWSAEDLAKIS